MRRSVLLLGFLLVATLAGCPGGTSNSPPADHIAMPEKLKEAGFLSDLDQALAKAKAEGKVVLAYVTPSWFT